MAAFVKFLFAMAMPVALAGPILMEKKFDCPTSSGAFPSPFDCTEFYICSNSIAHLFKCPANLYFDPKLGVCNFPDQVDCHVTPMPNTITEES